MLEVQKIALQRAINMLKGAGAQYKIILPDGTEYGELVASVAPERKRGPGKYPRGEVRAYFLPLVKSMQPGDVVCIPFGKYDPVTLQGNVSGWACHEWGAGSNVTQCNKADGCLEIMRTL